MSRTTIEVQMRTDKVDEVLHIISSTLEPLKYKQKIVDGETIWAKGDGVLMKMQCFGVTFTGHSVVIQGWLKDAVTGESPLEGFVGALPKKKMRDILEKFQQKITKSNL